MIKCYDCGAVFQDYEAREKQEFVSEFWGAPAYANIKICPECGSEEIEEYDEDENGEE